MLFSDLRKKQVINVMDGCCLGQIDDVLLDDSGAHVCAFVVPAAAETFLQRLRGAPNILIPFSCVQRIGNDVILARIEGYTDVNAKEK